MGVTGGGELTDQSSSVDGAGKVDLAKATAIKEFADFDREEGKHQQRWAMLWVVGGVFVALNAAVVVLINKAMGMDLGFVTAHPELADKRLITSTVFQTLIGATVVQTGAATWAMVRFLFPEQAD